MNQRARLTAMLLPVALMAGSAAAVPSRHPAQSHKAAAQTATVAHGKGHAAKSAQKAPAGKTAGSKASTHKTAAAPKSVARHQRGGRGRVAEPVTMDRSRAKPSAKPATQHRAGQPAPATEHVAAVAPVDSAVSASDKKALTVDDFSRAAGAPIVRPADNDATTAPSEIAACGESHPDPDERIAVADAPDDLPRPVTPAPIVRVQPNRRAATTAAAVPVMDASRPGRIAVPHAPVEDASLKSAETEPMKPVVNLYTRSGKLIVPAPLKGTHEILVHQNQMADDAGLSRIQDDEDLDRMRAAHLLVSFPETPGLAVNEELPLNRRYARPWTVKFATDTAKAFYAKFHEPLRLNSAVRTVDYQVQLRRINGNAAAIDGEAASPHLTGQAIDFGKGGMTTAELAWMRSYLLPLMQSGKVDVEEEFKQACFHISVYAGYLPKKHADPRTEVAQLREKQDVDSK